MIKDVFSELINKYNVDELFVSTAWKELEQQYTSKNRHYHNLDHLQNMLNDYSLVEDEIEHRDALQISIFYHDMIYNAKRKDNEQKSAEFFKKRISKTSFNYIDRSYNQILSTKKHEMSTDKDTNILLDLDLAILGYDKFAYNDYATNVRREYWMYPDFLYRNGRIKVLKHFIGMEYIYKTDFFRTKYEKQAKLNLAEELRNLN